MWLDGSLCLTPCKHLQHNFFIESSGQVACKSQTTILHNEKCYTPTYDMLDFMALVGKLGDNMCLLGAVQPGL